VTTDGYHVVMKAVRIAELKARLSAYLREVRRGHTVTVLDRDRPVAKIVPVAEASSLVVREPRPNTRGPARVPLPPRVRLRTDPVALLLEERQGGR